MAITSMKLTDGSIELTLSTGKTYSITATQVASLIASKNGSLANKKLAAINDIKAAAATNLTGFSGTIDIIMDGPGKVIDFIINN